VRHIKKDGTPLDVEVTTHDLEFAGQPARLAMLLDVTSRLRASADQALLAEERDRLVEDLELVLERMPVGCMINNTKGEITYWNRAAEHIFGFPAAEVLGKKMDAKILPEHVQERVDEIRLQIEDSHQNVHNVNQNLTKDGRLITCEWENVQLSREDSKFRGYLAMVRDITGQQDLAHERDHLLARLQRVMESAPVAFIVSDVDLRVSYWNPAAERIFGFSAEEAQGELEYDTIVPPENRALVQDNIQQMIESGREIRSLNENLTRDGRRIVCSWINTPLVSPDGQVRELVAIAEDITEQRRTALALEESERRFRGMFEDTPIPIWFVDYSQVKTELRRMQLAGVEDIRAYLGEHPAQLDVLVAKIGLLDINQAAVEMHHAANKADLLSHFADIFTAEAFPAMCDTMARVAAGERMFDLEYPLNTFDGQTLWGMLRWQAARGHEELADRVLVSVVDGSQGKKREAEQAASLNRLQLLTQAALEINSAPNLHELLQATVDWSRRITGAALGAASLSEDGEENQRIHIISAAEGMQTPRTLALQGHLMQRTFFKSLFAGRNVLRFSREEFTQVAVETPEDILILHEMRFNGYLVVPLIGETGSNLGILHLGDYAEAPFDASDEALATQLGLIAASALEKQTLLDQLRQAEERMRDLARQVVTAQEKERQLIARELHDETGQNLTALKLSLQMAVEDLPAGALGMHSQLREAINLAETVMNQTRELARLLRPPRLEAISLGASLEGLCIDFSKRLRIPVSYQGCSLPQMDDLMTLSIYRFVQEGLTNVARHAQANSAKVSLLCGEDTIEVSIEDDGHGFDTMELISQNGIGLRGMRERIEMLNGTLRIVTRHGQGSRLIARIPRKAL
jgi:PAS domain S-box-containing protein